jgi:hypothetical protein
MECDASALKARIVELETWLELRNAEIRVLTKEANMKRICSWCEKDLGEKPGEGETHTICEPCKHKLLGQLPTVEEYDREKRLLDAQGEVSNGE